MAKNGENVQLADAFSNTTNGFTMTGLKKDVKIYEGVASKEEVEQTNVNKVAVDVERVVAKVTVKMASSAENADPKLDLVSGGLELVSLDCQIGNPNLATYGTDNALDGEFAGTYRWANDALGYRSTPYYGVLAGVEEEIAYDATKFLSGTATKLWENKAAIANAVGKFYCLENTHAKGNYKKGNTTFVRVVTEMIPTKVAEFTYTPAEGEGEAKLSAANDEDYTKPNAAEAFYVIKGTPADETKMYDSYVLKSTVVALWKTINSKTEDPTETELNTFLTATLPGLGYTLSDEYVAGKGYYNVWVHDVKDNGVYAGSPVFRNDWYELIITKLTLPGNPSGEFNPEEPTYPDTFIGVTINLLKWNYFRHDVELQ